MSEKVEKIKLSKITKDHMGQKIKTFGWIKTIRTSGRVGTFIDLQLGFKTIKCLSPNIEKLTPHSSVTITGTVMPNLGKKDKHEFEIHIELLEVYRIAPSFPINEHSNLFTKLENGHLWLQTEERMEFLRARNELMHAMREFYYTNEYVEVTPPTLVQTQVEGGSTLFHLDYYGKEAYLTQSSQLYLETVVPATEKAFCVMPSYRAEKFNTTRHLSEYTHVEGEIADCTFEELLVEIETTIKYVLKRFKEKSFDIETYDDQFKRITYADAIETLRKNGVLKDKEEKVEYVYGDDISDRDEVQLIEILGGKPVFLINFPVEHKPFYCRKVKKAEEDTAEGETREVTESVDLLWPGIGEILGGSMREENYDMLMEGFKREEIDPANYYWYTDLRLFGANTHGGYGLGFERLLRALMKYETVNKACLYPRFPGRCRP